MLISNFFTVNYHLTIQMLSKVISSWWYIRPCFEECSDDLYRAVVAGHLRRMPLEELQVSGGQHERREAVAIQAVDV